MRIFARMNPVWVKTLFHEIDRLSPGPRAIAYGHYPSSCWTEVCRTRQRKPLAKPFGRRAQIVIRTTPADEKLRSSVLYSAAITMARLGSFRSSRMAAEGCSTRDRMPSISILRAAKGMSPIQLNVEFPAHRTLHGAKSYRTRRVTIEPKSCPVGQTPGDMTVVSLRNRDAAASRAATAPARNPLCRSLHSSAIHLR